MTIQIKAWTVYDEDLNVVISDGTVHTNIDVYSNHHNYKPIVDALINNDADKFLEYYKGKAYQPQDEYPELQDCYEDDLVITNGKIFYRGKEVDEAVCKYVAKLQSMNADITGMKKYIGRMYNNVSEEARDQQFRFINLHHLVVDPEGYIIAYKAVKNNYMDKHSGTISYEVGNIVKMKRSEVDDDTKTGCSKGLHAGSLKYVYSYGSSDDRIIIVRIDPADVVCIPKDCNFQKMRCCRLQVLGDYQGELYKPAYTSNNVNEMYSQNGINNTTIDDKIDWEEVERLHESNMDDEAIDDYFEEGDITVTTNDDVWDLYVDVMNDFTRERKSFSAFNVTEEVRSRVGRGVPVAHYDWRDDVVAVMNARVDYEVNDNGVYRLYEPIEDEDDDDTNVVVSVPVVSTTADSSDLANRPADGRFAGHKYYNHRDAGGKFAKKN